jgi:hypothetical protein
MAAQGAEETLAELEKIASGEKPEESATGKPEVTKASGKPDGDWIPKARLNEVISARNEQAEEAKTWKAKAAESDKSIANLTAMLASAQKSQETINDLRQLANDPVHGPHVRYLHSVLIGEPIEFEGSEPLPENATPEQKEEHRLTEIQRAQEELAASLEDQKSDAIVQRADLIADRWLEALPDEYTAEDRNAVAHLWTSRVDWKTVQNNPAALEQVLTDSFQDTLNIYGPPRGALFTPEQVEELKQKPSGETPMALTPEEELGQLFASKNYGSFKSTGKKNFAGTEIMAPEVSDDDFARDMARALKIQNRGK